MHSFHDRPVCLSGGADGADLQWGMCAGTAGHQVFHFIFQGHRSKAPKSELVVLPEELLLKADSALEKANETLKRRWPVKNAWVANLLRRNFYQIESTDAVYAVSTIGTDGLVSGGTSWAIQMAIDRDKPVPIFVFDQVREQWFRWDGMWVTVDAPPPPTGVWTGIGSRELNESGKQAIRSLLGYKRESRETSSE